MFYIHQSTCISPQQTFSGIDLDKLNKPVDNKLTVMEPAYEGIPPGILRRMGKAVRIGVGAALPVIRQNPDGIIIGTANGGMEDCIKFLNQIIDYDEGMLAPGNFVQSTTNALAGQLGMMGKNTGYNITHVHRALAFENAMIDASMMLNENKNASYLLGGVDEISAYNYNIEFLGGWYKPDQVSGTDLYNYNSPGSIAGEGAAMFLVSAISNGALAAVQAVHILHEEDEQAVGEQLRRFLADQLAKNEKIDWLITGENGDNRLQKYYDRCENVMDPDTGIARFKHITGEYPTATAVALWLACYVMGQQKMLPHMIKKSSSETTIRKILIYNNYKGSQHSFILLTAI